MIHDLQSLGDSCATSDDMVYTAVFSPDSAAKAEARKQIHLRERQACAVASSIFPLYDEIGHGKLHPTFTVPAHNIRALTYDVARALFRAAMRHDAGAFIFEIARSEIGYTEQRPAEYAACVLAAAIKEGYKGPVFIQGDHFQASAKKWATPDGRASEVKALESLIDEAIAAEFYNIDIDTSTLVDLPQRISHRRIGAARRVDAAGIGLQQISRKRSGRNPSRYAVPEHDPRRAVTPSFHEGGDPAILL